MVIAQVNKCYHWHCNSFCLMDNHSITFMQGPWGRTIADFACSADRHISQ